MQACLTKFFKNLGTDKPNYEYLFQKEEADRKQREEEERQRRAELERKQAEEEERLYALYLERKERISVSRRKRSEEKRAAREAQSKTYCEGMQITKGVFLDNRLAALNSEWLCDNGITHVMNVTKDIQNYYLDERYPEDNDNTHPTSHALVEEPEEESTDNKEGDGSQEGEHEDKQVSAESTSEVKAEEQSDKAEEGSRIRYRRFAIEDSRDEELPYEEIEAAVRFVQSAHMASEGRALIHCREGKSRSVTILLSYLMIAKRWPLQRAFNHVKERAPWINVNEGFLKLLMDIEVRLFKENSIDFFDKQDRKERIDYCEIDFEEIERSRRRTSTRSKKTSAQEKTKEVKETESVVLESTTVASVETSSTSSASTESAAVKEESPVTGVPVEPEQSATTAPTSADVVMNTTTESSDTITTTVTAVSEVTPVNDVTPNSQVTSEVTPVSTEHPITQTSVEETEDKENGGDVQNVNASVLGKRKREKPESKDSPAKKKKKANLPEPKVNIMSFFKRIE